MKRLLIFIAFSIFILPLSAEIPDSVWEAMIERQLIIVKSNGDELEGSLISVDESDVNVMKKDGAIVTLSRQEVEEVRGISTSPPTEKQSKQKDIPPGSSYFLVNPLGFLQMGPIIEYGFLVSPELYIAPHIRLMGLGLLSQTASGSTMKVHSFSAGAAVYKQTPPDEGNNRIYFGGNLELGFSFEKGDVGTNYEWEGSTTLLITGASFGYKWRKPTRFFMSLGIFAGAAFTMASDWYYIDDPDTIYEEENVIYFVGGIEFSLGWEKE